VNLYVWKINDVLTEKSGLKMTIETTAWHDLDCLAKLELIFVRLGNFRLSNFDVHLLLLLYVLSRPSGLRG